MTDLFVSIAASVDLSQGLPRDIYLKVLHLLFEERFGWPETVTNTVIQEYTNWENVDDPVENFEQYIQVYILKIT